MPGCSRGLRFPSNSSIVGGVKPIFIAESMPCFYHDEREPVGGCKSCGKALCRECAVDLGKGLACRGHCEADVQALIQLIDRNIQISPTSASLIKSSRSTRSGVAVFQFLMGAVFVGWAFTDLARFKFLLILGVGFIAY